MTNREQTIVDALRIIEPKIEQLVFVIDEKNANRERIPIVKLRDSDIRYPLGSMGDGINRILTILLAMANVENGILIIDEFENGLHYTIQKQLWKMIFELAERLHIQVFATTHSNDCINSFAAVLNEADNQNKGQFIRLERVRGKNKAICYQANELDIVSRQNMEVR
jgi:AAA15 family ATPase/GTPase